MTKYPSPETPLHAMLTSSKLYTFAIDNKFDNIRQLVSVGFKELHSYSGFNVRLQREIMTIIQNYKWENALKMDCKD